MALATARDRVLEDTRPLTEASSDSSHRGLPRDFVSAPRRHGLQPCRPADRKTDEAMDTRRDVEPAHHRLLVRPAAEDDAADRRAAVAPRRFDGLLAILATIEPLDLPDIRLDAGVLKRADRVRSSASDAARDRTPRGCPDASS